jgi:uncharacterized membrane protein YoaK (UPF0700 family)
LYLPTKEESRLLATSRWIADAFWFALVILMVIAAFRHFGARDAIDPRLGVLLLMVLSLSAMHAFFQSESKHHVNVVVMLAILAASIVSNPGERKSANTRI